MIAKSQMGELYSRTIQTYNREPKDGEFDAWLNVIGGFQYADLDAALRRWQADTTIEEFSNRPKGARMPTAAELRESIERFDRSKLKKFIPCGSCREGWVKVFQGQTEGGNQIDPKMGAMKRCQCFLNYVADRAKAC